MLCMFLKVKEQVRVLPNEGIYRTHNYLKITFDSLLTDILMPSCAEVWAYTA